MNNFVFIHALLRLDEALESKIFLFSFFDLYFLAKVSYTRLNYKGKEKWNVLR